MTVTLFEFTGINSPSTISVIPLGETLWFNPEPFFWKLNVYERGEDLGRSKFLASLEDYQKRQFTWEVEQLGATRAYITTVISESGLYALLYELPYHEERRALMRRFVDQVILPYMRFGRKIGGVSIKTEEKGYSLVI
ncbi:BRO-N domain-containing protein [Hymenobacter arcticus]